MSKAFKFTDNNYLDSTGVVHERTPLNEILDNLGDTLPINSMFEYEGNTVPTGYEEVSEMSGSNSNGSWIKFADGTMICSGTPSGSTTFSGYWTTFRRSPDSGSSILKATFPVPFVNTPVVTANAKANYAQCSLLTYIPTNTDFSFIVLKPSSSTDNNYAITYIAIGRWK